MGSVEGHTYNATVNRMKCGRLTPWWMSRSRFSLRTYRPSADNPDGCNHIVSGRPVYSFQAGRFFFNNPPHCCRSSQYPVPLHQSERPACVGGATPAELSVLTLTAQNHPRGGKDEEYEEYEGVCVGRAASSFA
jgi:hypothetical protein